MLSDADALLDAIWAAPDDDTPRLVYADWLEEHDEPELAAFVRVSVERFRLLKLDPQYDGLQKEEAAAWKAYKRKWNTDLTLGKIGRWHFERGVISEVVGFTTSAFMARSAGWGPGFPVRRVRLHDTTGLDSRIGSCPFLDRLSEFLIGPNVWDGYEEALAKGRTAAGAVKVPAAVVLAVCGSPAIRRMKRLCLNSVPPSRAMFTALAKFPALDATELSFSLVPVRTWGRPWHEAPIRSFTKSENVPIAVAVSALLNGRDATHLID